MDSPPSNFTSAGLTHLYFLPNWPSLVFISENNALKSMQMSSSPLIIVGRHFALHMDEKGEVPVLC